MDGGGRKTASCRLDRAARPLSPASTLGRGTAHRARAGAAALHVSSVVHSRAAVTLMQRTTGNRQPCTMRRAERCNVLKTEGSAVWQRSRRSSCARLARKTWWHATRNEWCGGGRCTAFDERQGRRAHDCRRVYTPQVLRRTGARPAQARAGSGGCQHSDRERLVPLDVHLHEVHRRAEVVVQQVRAHRSSAGGRKQPVRVLSV